MPGVNAQADNGCGTTRSRVSQPRRERDSCASNSTPSSASLQQLPARKCRVKASYRIPVQRHIRCGTRVGSRMADEKGACGVNVKTHRTREARAGTILAVLCPHKQGRAKANANDSRRIVEHVDVLCDRDVRVQPGRGWHKRAAHLARGTVTPDTHVEANMAGAEAAERETNERAARRRV